MKKTVLFTAGFACLLLIKSCIPPVEVEKSSIITSIVLNGEDTLFANADYSTRMQGAAHSGQYSFRADSAHEYAAGVKIDLHDSLINSAIRVNLNYWIKSSNPMKGDGMAVAFFHQNDEMSSWTSFDVIKYTTKANEWVYVADSVTIPADKFNKNGMFFKIFTFNPNRKANVDVDDINITLKKVVKVME